MSLGVRFAVLLGKLRELPEEDLAAVEQLVALLPSAKLASMLVALDARHAKRGGAGPGDRPPDGASIVLRSLVLRAVRALQAQR